MTSARPTPLYVLRIEVDGHLRGGPAPKPWVARIDGPSPRYGLTRTFLDAINDWRNASRAWSGNVYGKVATFALREGHLYEISRCRGRASKRGVVREFRWCEGGRLHERSPDDILAFADPAPGAATAVTLDDGGASWVARIKGIGTPQALPWVVTNGMRRYRVGDGVYEIVNAGSRLIVGIRDGIRHTLTDAEALSWLR